MQTSYTDDCYFSSEIHLIFYSRDALNSVDVATVMATWGRPKFYSTFTSLRHVLVIEDSSGRLLISEELILWLTRAFSGILGHQLLHTQAGSSV